MTETESEWALRERSAFLNDVVNIRTALSDAGIEVSGADVAGAVRRLAREFRRVESERKEFVRMANDALERLSKVTAQRDAAYVSIRALVGIGEGDPVAGEGNPSTDPYTRIEQLTQENAELWAERDAAYAILAEHGLGGISRVDTSERIVNAHHSRSTFVRRRRQNPTAEQIAADEGRDLGELCSTCHQPMDSPPCSLNPETRRSFHTVAGLGGRAAALEDPK